MQAGQWWGASTKVAMFLVAIYAHIHWRNS